MKKRSQSACLPKDDYDQLVAITKWYAGMPKVFHGCFSDRFHETVDEVTSEFVGELLAEQLHPPKLTPALVRKLIKQGVGSREELSAPGYRVEGYLTDWRWERGRLVGTVAWDDNSEERVVVRALPKGWTMSQWLAVRGTLA
jgi:hypothetical protein